MKSLVIIIIILFTVNLFTREDTPIGSGVDTWNMPLNQWYMDKRLQTIYLVSEFANESRDFPLEISCVKLNLETIPDAAYNQFKIRMKEIEDSTLSYFDNTGLVTIFDQSNLTIGNPGWVSFPFNRQTFPYSGTNNFLIDFYF